MILRIDQELSDSLPVTGAGFDQTLATASPDLLREMARQFAQRMMDAQVEQVCGASYGEMSAEDPESA